MTFIYIIFKLTILVNSPQIPSSGLLRTDYYESMSYPILCVVICHYHPSGPPFLFTRLKYSLYSYIFGYISKNVTIDIGLKKINGLCNSSIFFSTVGKDFKKLEVEIFISFYYNNRSSVNIGYTIYKGICVGSYKFWDYSQHFSFNVKITNDMKDYLITSNSTLMEMESYVNSISNNQSEICLVTKNNNAIVLTPEYRNGIPDGLISGFFADFYEDGGYFDSRYYPAFQCTDNNIYPNVAVVLFIDRRELDIHFYVQYSKFIDRKVNKTEYEIELPNAEFEKIDNLRFIHHSVKKLFLQRYTLGTVTCPDGTKRTLYISENQYIYYIIYHRSINISSSLTQKRDFSLTIENMCQ